MTPTRRAELDAVAIEVAAGGCWSCSSKRIDDESGCCSACGVQVVAPAAVRRRGLVPAAQRGERADFEEMLKRRLSPAAAERAERWAAAEAIVRSDVIFYHRPYRREVVHVRDAVMSTMFTTALDESPLALVAGQRECGGYLFGEQRGDRLVVVSAEAAYREQTRSSVILDRTPLRSREEPVGAWHVHPTENQDPSDGDLVEAARDAARSPDGRWLELIGGITLEGTLGVSGYRVRRRRAEGASWAVEPVRVELVP